VVLTALQRIEVVAWILCKKMETVGTRQKKRATTAAVLIVAGAVSVANEYRHEGAPGRADAIPPLGPLGPLGRVSLQFMQKRAGQGDWWLDRRAKRHLLV